MVKYICNDYASVPDPHVIDNEVWQIILILQFLQNMTKQTL